MKSRVFKNFKFVSFTRFSIPLLIPLGLLFSSSIIFANETDKKLSVVYLGSDHPDFWRKTRQFASIVASDLDITLRFKTGEDRFAKLTAMRELVKEPNKPDYLIFSYTKNAGAQMMAMAEEANIPYILINSDIPAEERNLTRYPREKFLFQDTMQLLPSLLLVSRLSLQQHTQLDTAFDFQRSNLLQTSFSF